MNLNSSILLLSSDSWGGLTYSCLLTCKWVWDEPVTLSWEIEIGQIENWNWSEWNWDGSPEQFLEQVVCTPCTLLERLLPGTQSPWTIGLHIKHLIIKARGTLVFGINYTNIYTYTWIAYKIFDHQSLVFGIRSTNIYILIFGGTLGWGPLTLTFGHLSSSKPRVCSCPPLTWSAPRYAVDITLNAVDIIWIHCFVSLHLAYVCSNESGSQLPPGHSVLVVKAPHLKKLR